MIECNSLCYTVRPLLMHSKYNSLHLPASNTQSIPLPNIHKEAQAEIKIAGRNINNLRYADDTLWQKVKRN